MQQRYIAYGLPDTTSPAARVNEEKVVATLPVSLTLTVPFQVDNRLIIDNAV